jgi:hypothetical protein
MDGEHPVSAQSLVRRRRLVEDAIAVTGLDLSGLTVLTEVGTNDFALTPIIAKLAGADTVFCWVRDSRWGKALDVIKAFAVICADFGVDFKSFAIRENVRPAEDVGRANIITNSGMLRPLDAEMLASANPEQCVISLMYDAWEVRPADIAMNACRYRGLRVCGTNESDPDFPIFSYVGPLVAKMLLEAGFEVMGNNILLWSGDEFGSTARDYLKTMGAINVWLTTSKTEVMSKAPSADALILADYHGTKSLFGLGACSPDHVFDLDTLREIAPGLGIVHLYGALDAHTIRDAGFVLYPDRSGAPQTMTFTLAHVGTTPAIRLTVAGLRAGQEVVRGEVLRFAQPVLNMTGVTS